jgi:light-harvesting complex I chlorophyll a/b binding protein 1
LNGDKRSPDGLGVDPGPLGLFDPLGFVKDTESFPRRRAVEIKHGRIAMVAFVGMLVQELGWTFPGSLDLKGQVPFASVLDDGMGFPALAKIPLVGVVQIVAFAAIAELYAVPASQYTGGPQNLPGGYDGAAGRIPGGYPGQQQIKDPDARDRALNVEIQNGRAAMLGVTGAMIHSMLDSTDHHFFYPITHN